MRALRGGSGGFRFPGGSGGFRFPGDLGGSSRSGNGFPLTITGYAGREFLISFGVAFAFFFVVFFVNQILLMAEDILARRAPPGQVMLLLLYSLPSIVAISAPFASLGGALMASARLGADNEMMAMAACGVRTGSVFAPFAAIALCIALLSFVANDVFLPLGTIEFGKLYRSLISSSAAIELQPWSVKTYSGATVVTGEGREGGLADVVVFDTRDGKGRRILSADFARLDVLEGGFDAILHLQGVTEHRRDPADASRFTVTEADSMEYRVAIRERVKGVAGTGPGEMSSRDLAALIRTRQQAFDLRVADRLRETGKAGDILQRRYREALRAHAEDAAKVGPGIAGSLESLDSALGAYRTALAQKPQDRTLQVYRLELHKKFSIPAAAFFFAFLAFPLGLGARKAGRTAGFGLGLLLAVAYWSLLLAGQTLGMRMGYPPALSMWLPNILVAIAAAVIWLWRRLASRGVL